MKKILILAVLFICPLYLLAEDKQPIVPTAQKPLSFIVRPGKEQRKLFKQRNKQIRQLTKAYRKATTNEEKAAIKVQLAQLVSQATDESMAWAKARIEAEKNNLATWETKLKEREQNLEEIKARRVDEILSGEAEQRFKLAKKRWKKEMKDLKKSMK